MRCYQGNPPDAPPCLWLVANDLPNQQAPSPVYVWPDRSYLQNNGVALDVNNAPRFISSAPPFALVQSTNTNQLTLTNTISLSQDFSIHLVGAVSGTLGFPIHVLELFPSSSNAAWPMGILDTGMNIHVAPQSFSAAAPDPVGMLHVFSARRVSGVVTLYLDGTPLGSTAVGGSQVFQLQNVNFSVPGLNRTAVLALTELRVYDGPVSDTGFNNIVTSLRTAYGL